MILSPTRADFRRAMLIVAAIGYAVCIVGLVIDPKAMLASYLTAWIAISAVPMGALAILFTSYLVRAGWTHDLNRLLASAALTTPVAGILFIPVLVGMAWIYPWVSDASHLPPFKAAYLVPWFFVLRTIAYFVILTVLAVWGARAYGDEFEMKRSASVGLIVWALVVSWAGIDWMESVEPDFHSSIYGLFAVDFELLAGLCFGIVALLLVSRTRQMSNSAYAATLFSVLLLWAYMHAMQYIIIWAGDIPDEIVWYLERLKDGWAYPLWALYILQFIVPFFALLSEKVRGGTAALMWLASATLALRYLEAAVFILPPLHLSAWAWLDLPAAIVATGAAWLFAWQAMDWIWLARRSGRAAAAH